MALYFIHDYDNEQAEAIPFTKKTLEDTITYTDKNTSFTKLCNYKYSYEKDNLLITFTPHGLQANVELRKDPDLIAILDYLKPSYFRIDGWKHAFPIENFYSPAYVTGLLNWLI